MEVMQQNIIREVEDCKDILWYLKGQVDLADNSCETYPFDKEHIKSFERVISFVQNRVLKEQNEYTRLYTY